MCSLNRSGSGPVVGFFQQEPNQGQPVSESTEVWVAYDDKALYIAARMHDAHPDSIIARLARRDNDASSDEFAVGIDLTMTNGMVITSSYRLQACCGMGFFITTIGTTEAGMEYGKQNRILILTDGALR